jgi:hypothetical protein
MQTYTDPRLLDEAEALAALPDIPLTDAPPVIESREAESA